MSDDSKSREELIEELAELRRQLSNLTKIEVVLKEERERTQSYLDLAGVMFVAIDATGTVILANRKTCNVLGYEEKEIIGRNWFDTFLPQRVQETVKKVFKTIISGENGPNEYHENPVLSKSGVERLIAWHNTILRDDKGMIIASLSSGEDITERKQAEKALVESERLLREAQKIAHIGTYNRDLKTGKGVWSEEVYRIYGYSPGKVTPTFEFVRDHTHPDDREMLLETNEALITSNTPYDIEYRIIRMDGEERAVRSWATLEFDSSGAPERIVGMLQDITARKQTEKALMESEARFRAIMASTTDFIFTKDTESRYTYVNRAMAELFGCQPGDLLGKTPDEIFDPEYAEIVNEVDKLALNGEIVDQVRSLCLGEQVHHFHTVQVALTEADGNLDGICGIVRDITEQKEVEEALRESEERFRTFYNANRDGYVIVLGTGEILDANPRLLEMLGYSIDEVRMKNFWKITPEKWRKWEYRVHGKVLFERGYTDLYEKEYVRKDGTIVPIEVQAYILERGKDLESSRIGGFVRDITDRKRIEEEREHAYAFLQTVIDGFPEEMMVINRDYTIALANQTVRVQAGEDPVTACLKCHEVSHNRETPCEDEEHPCPLLKVFETRKPFSVEHIHFDDLGNEKIVEVIAAPIFNERGDVVQIIESCRDLTDRKKAEEGRLDLERQVQHAQKLESLGVLAGGIAHDFNNILMAILGNADLALHDLSTANPVYTNVKEIEFAARRAADLARQMLAYSGKGKFLIEKISLNEAVEEMTHMLKVSISKKAVIKFHLADNLPMIEADATQIRQIIMNLVTNASDAIDRTSGVISISTGAMDCDSAYLSSTYVDESLPEGQYVFVEVTDTGSGMNEETQEKLFDPFYSTKFTGRGLGLSTVLGIILSHGGAIKVYSELGKGTSIKVLLPACRDSNEISETETGEMREEWTGSGTILLVDDEESILSIGKQMLERIGFDVLTACDGREALSRFREHSDMIDLVILDLTMPHLDGEEAFRELRRIRRNIRVLMSSGYNEQEVTQRFSGKPLAGFLQKPYVFTELRARIQEILEK